jgi:hypothetical protein
MGATVTPGEVFSADIQGFATDLIGSIGVAWISASDGTTAIARTTDDIIEIGGGVYIATLTAPVVPGDYLLVWDDGLGNPSAIDDVSVRAITAATLPALTGANLCTLTDVRAAMELEATETSKDALISDLIVEASALITAEAGREFADSGIGSTRRFELRGHVLRLAPFDLQAGPPISISLDGGDALTVDADYYLEPLPSPWGIVERIRFTGGAGPAYAFSFSQPIGPNVPAMSSWDGRRIVTITGTWGFPVVPPIVRRAAVVQVKAWMAKPVASMNLPDYGEARSMQPPAIGGLALAPDVRRLLSTFRRRGIG